MLDSYETPIFDLAIIGLGPGGLAACFEAAQAGKCVCAFSDRTSYIRGQRVLLDQNTSMYLDKYPLNPDPQNNILVDKIKKDINPQIKDIERLLFKKLEPFIASGLVRVVEVKRNQRDNMHLEQKTDSVTIEYASKKYPTRHILAADGVNRNFAKLMNRDLGADIRFNPIEEQPRYRYHAAIQLQIKYPPCQKIILEHDPRLMSKEELHRICQDADAVIRYQDQFFYYEHQLDANQIQIMGQSLLVTKLLCCICGWCKS